MSKTIRNFRYIVKEEVPATGVSNMAGMPPTDSEPPVRITNYKTLNLLRKKAKRMKTINRS